MLVETTQRAPEADVRSMPRRGRNGTKPSSRDVELFWQERRAHKRRILVARVELDLDGQAAIGVTENISQGGAFVATFRSLPEGSHVRLTFELPGPSPTTIVATAKVMRVRGAAAPTKGGPAPEVVPGMGLKFVDLSSAAFDAIGAYVAAADR